jgi:hypothetical protein
LVSELPAGAERIEMLVRMGAMPENDAPTVFSHAGPDQGVVEFLGFGAFEGPPTNTAPPRHARGSARVDIAERAFRQGIAE